jgi:hypothetical protein
MENEITTEQKKSLNKLGNRFFAQSVFNGASHALMLCLINFILVMAQQIFDLDSTLGLILSVGSGFFVIRRMFSINKENYDRFNQEAKKIIDQK